MKSQLEKPPIITLADYSDNSLGSVRFGKTSSQGIDEVTLKIKVGKKIQWNLIIQAIDMDIFLTKSIVLKEKSDDPFCIISYGGNIVYGHANLINSFSELNTGGCLLLEKISSGNIVLVLGFKNIAIFDSNGNFWEEEHDMQDYDSWNIIDGSRLLVNFSFRGETRRRIYSLSTQRLALENSSGDT